jgi:hypothetical protein
MVPGAVQQVLGFRWRSVVMWQPTITQKKNLWYHRSGRRLGRTYSWPGKSGEEKSQEVNSDSLVIKPKP